MYILLFLLLSLFKDNLAWYFGFIFVYVLCISLYVEVLLIFGICGALRCAELTNLKVSEVQESNDSFIVTINDTKTYIDRSFIIGPLFYSKVKKYISLRPAEQFTDRFFIKYTNGTCQQQVIGKNKIGSVPSEIASYLKLENPSKYTGHCLRRSATTFLSNSGASMTMIKQLGGWRSDSVASGYIAESMKSKQTIFEGITHENKNTTTVVPGSSNQVDSFNNHDDKTEKSNVYFIDEDLSSFFDDENEFTETVKFQTGSGKSVLTPSNSNNLRITSFRDKPPVKVDFKEVKSEKNKTLSSNKTTNVQSTSQDFPPSKKQKVEEKNASTCKDGNFERTENQKVVFENCTINGNLNYYFCTENH